MDASTQPASTGAADASLMYRHNVDGCWWSVIKIPQIADCKDGDIVPFVRKDKRDALVKVLRMVEATIPHMGGNPMSTFNILKDIAAALKAATGGDHGG